MTYAPPLDAVDRAGLEIALGALYPWAKRLALMLCRDPHAAEDLVQDAFVAAIRRPPAFVATEDLRAWLRTVLVRMNGRRIRTAARELRALARLGHRDEPVAALSAATREVMDALDGLGPKQRACVVLFYLEDLSEQAVADALGIRHGTVKAHLAQARARLRESLRAPDTV
jgi:RNA polymerase sigma factor (sigma-70 family)